MTTILEPATEVRHHVAAIHLDPESRSGDGLKLSGYAAVFDSESRDLGFTETLRPNAFSKALLRKGDDQVLLWQHDSGAPLARRSTGSLKLSEDAKGLRFEAKLPATTLARDALELVRSGVIQSMSFSFSMAGGSETVEERGGEVYRTIHEVGRLLEVSLVTDPAYAATSVEPRSVALAAIRKGRLAITERSPYGADSEHSYFRDFARVEMAAEARKAMRGSGPLTEHWQPPETIGPRPNALADTLEAAKRRLDTAKRAMSTGSGSQEPFAPSTAAGAGYIADLFAAAVRSLAPLAAALPHADLPVGADVVSTARFTAGASVAVQTADNAAAATADMTSALVKSPVVTIAGFLDASQQLADQSPGGSFDRACTLELARAYAERLEVQLLNGTGASGQMTGLLNTASPTTLTYTDASPTLAKTWSAICQLDSLVHKALGQGPDLIVLAPRRREWIRAVTVAGSLEWEWETAETPSMPENLSSTQDAIILLSMDYVTLVSRPPSINVYSEVLSGTLGVRFEIAGYAALLVRQPVAVGLMTGSGLTSPSFP